MLNELTPIEVRPKRSRFWIIAGVIAASIVVLIAVAASLDSLGATGY